MAWTDEPQQLVMLRAPPIDYGRGPILIATQKLLCFWLLESIPHSSSFPAVPTRIK
jgi:hypothetical protein